MKRPGKSADQAGAQAPVKVTKRSVFAFDWTEAFDKFGFGDGDGDVHTHKVALTLSAQGYAVTTQWYGLHNQVIVSIKQRGIELISASAEVGYDNPRQYLPAEIVTILDGRKEVPS